MAVTDKVLSIVAVVGGVNYVQIERTNCYTDHKGEETVYTYTFETFEGEGLEQLNNIRIALEHLSSLEEDSAEAISLIEKLNGDSLDGIIDIFEEEAAEIAEDLDIAFIYEGSNGKREYTPASFWSASGSCEWEESAQYGDDYGWNI